MRCKDDHRRLLVAAAFTALALSVTACADEVPATDSKPAATARSKPKPATTATAAAQPADTGAPAATGAAAGNGAPDPTHKYIGVEKCAKCHKSEKKGNQFAHWQKSRHSHAFETLSSPKAKEAAKNAGVEDPTTDAKCLKCHVTAYGVDGKWLDDGFDPKNGVQCESCHGPGGDFAKKRIMENEKDAIEQGLVLPTKEVCVRCHNAESPFYKEFDFDRDFAKIKHPRPEK